MFIPVDISADGRLKASEQTVEAVDFSVLKVTEAAIEEFLRQNIGLIFEDDEDAETLLIVGQQVVNAKGARNDLVALDSAGNLVLIEIKRDAADIAQRREPFEFQAVRYAASLATIATVDDLVDKIFARYIAKHRGEFPPGDLTAEEIGKRIITKFLAENNAEKTFNNHQRIMLVASRFDPQTLSAVAWLSEYDVDISCIALTPYKQGASTYIACERLIPDKRTDSYFIGFDHGGAVEPGTVTRKGTKTRTNLPRIPKLIEWGIVKIGATLRIKGYENSAAKVIDAKDVEFNGKRMTYNQWGGAVTGWSAICIYDWAITEDGRTLTDQRAERMAAEEAKAAAAIAETAPDETTGE